MTAAAALAAVVLGLIGIGQLDPRTAIVDRLYGTVELFSFSFETGTAPSLPIALEIARFLAPVTVAYAGFQAIAAIFVPKPGHPGADE
jgi:hypothetical protein